MSISRRVWLKQKRTNSGLDGIVAGSTLAPVRKSGRLSSTDRRPLCFRLKSFSKAQGRPVWAKITAGGVLHPMFRKGLSATAPNQNRTSDCRNRPILLSATRSKALPWPSCLSAPGSRPPIPGIHHSANNVGSAKQRGANTTALTDCHFCNILYSCGFVHGMDRAVRDARPLRSTLNRRNNHEEVSRDCSYGGYVLCLAGQVMSDTAFAIDRCVDNGDGTVTDKTTKWLH